MRGEAISPAEFGRRRRVGEAPHLDTLDSSPDLRRLLWSDGECSSRACREPGDAAGECCALEQFMSPSRLDYRQPRVSDTSERVDVLNRRPGTDPSWTSVVPAAMVATS